MWTRLQQEEARVEHYLYRSTGAQLTRVVKENLLRAHVVAILEKGFDDLMDAARLDDLGRMYQLLALVDGLPQLRLAFSLYMKRVGSALVGDTERDHLLVQELLNLKEKLDGILEKSFEANEQLTNTLKEGFEHFINLRQNKPAELVARFIDGKLRSGNKGCSEEELEETLDKAMTLFRYIDGKDMFEAFYKKDLSKRLLLGKSASIDAEKSIISKLKAECGSGFTSKLEGMFKDVELSRDVMSSFRNSSHAQTLASREAGELSVHVLTQGYWPTYPPVEINLPSEILELQQADPFLPYVRAHSSHISPLKFFSAGESRTQVKHPSQAPKSRTQISHRFSPFVTAHPAHASLPFLLLCFQLFSSYYISKHNGRRLQWQPYLGHCTVKASFPLGRKEMSVSLLQTVVLLYFNEADEIPYRDLLQASAIDEKELKVTLQSLACGKVRVLPPFPPLTAPNRP